jgi:starch phosphorylase
MHLFSILDALANNLWWSWDSEATALWPELSIEAWRNTGHNPVATLLQLTDARRADLAADPALGARVSAIHGRFSAYMCASGWASTEAPAVQARGVAYLSMEFGLHESLPLYSGGLGVLAGDHMRSASDLGVNLRGIGILWRQGYFRQDLIEGRQVARYVDTDPVTGPYQQVMDGDAPLSISVPLGDEQVTLHVWRVNVGRVPLYLLDAAHPNNDAATQALTNRLYGGDHQTRARQEVLLGLGAIRLLAHLGHVDMLVHMNEGHCAFAPLQMAANRLGTEPWSTATTEAAKRVVFTTHTPVPAGHDRFGWSDIQATLGPWRDSLGLPHGAFMDLGRVNPTDLEEPLCMTVLALRLSAAANGVSKLHGEVSRQMWGPMWPTRPQNEVPIGHITNGVHPIFWVSDPARDLFDTHLPGWRDRVWDTDLWASAQAIPDPHIAAMRRSNRVALVTLARERTGANLDPDALTVGFARRFAPYKRGDLIFGEPDRLAAWLEQGAQLVYAGKAHPKDVAGQQIVAAVARWSNDSRFRDRVVLIPDYDITVGRLITAGSDVWLNNPRRPREASGTSGQKVVYNGGLNLSVLDGWWPEGYDGSNGWAIGDGRTWDDIEAGDTHDAADLYRLLEQEVMPTWRDPSAWWQRVRRNWITCAPAFSSHRMVRDYVLKLYEPRC